MFPFNYDQWLESIFQKKERQQAEYEGLIRYIKENDLHDNPDSLTLYQAQELVKDHQIKINTKYD